MGRLSTSDIILDEAAQNYLNTKSKSTANIYRTFLRYFRVFYANMLLEDFEKQRELNKTLPLTKKKRFLEDVAREFIKFLQKHDYSNNTIRAALAAFQNFLSYYNIRLSYSFIERPSSRPLEINEKHTWYLDQIKDFVDSTEYLRDKAIIMCLFQSGLSISDLLKLNYGDIRREFESDILPLMIHTYRKKTDVEFITFLGADSINYLREYLKTRSNLKDNSPLFTNIGTENRAKTGSIQNLFRSYAEKMDWIDESNMEGWNPARPHSLRAAFRSMLTNKVDRTLIEFWMGHSIGEVSRAYLNIPDEKMREIYENFEHELSIETTSKNVKLGVDNETAKIREEYKSQIDEMDTTIKTLSTQVSQLTDLNSRLEKDVESLKDEVMDTVKGALHFWKLDQKRSFKTILDLVDEVESLREKIHNLEYIENIAEEERERVLLNYTQLETT